MSAQLLPESCSCSPRPAPLRLSAHGFDMTLVLFNASMQAAAVHLPQKQVHTHLQTAVQARSVLVPLSPHWQCTRLQGALNDVMLSGVCTVLTVPQQGT